MNIGWLYLIGGAGLGISIKSLIEDIVGGEELITDLIRVVLWITYVVAVHYGIKRKNKKTKC